MNNKYFSENIRAYLDKIKADGRSSSGEVIKSDAQAIKELIDRISVRSLSDGISERAVRKWLNGESLPEASTLIILSEVVGVSVDELLKDKIIDCGILPKWYEELCEDSKKILGLALEAYENSEIPAFDGEAFKTAEMLKSPKFRAACNFHGTEETVDSVCKTELLPQAYFYFKVTASDDELSIASDEPLNYAETVKKETERHRKKYRAERISEWLDKNRNASVEKYKQELPKIVDVEYFEESVASPFYYDAQNCLDKASNVWRTLDDSETEAWNEVPYYFTENTDLLKKYKTNLTVRANERFIAGVNRQIAVIANKYFKELTLSGVTVYDTRFVKFCINDDYVYTESDYLRVNLTFTVSEDELRKVMLYNYSEKLKKRKREIAKSRENAERSVKYLRELSEKIDKGLNL